MPLVIVVKSTIRKHKQLFFALFFCLLTCCVFSSQWNCFQFCDTVLSTNSGSHLLMPSAEKAAEASDAKCSLFFLSLSFWPFTEYVLQYVLRLQSKQTRSSHIWRAFLQTTFHLNSIYVVFLCILNSVFFFSWDLKKLSGSLLDRACSLLHAGNNSSGRWEG